MAITRGAMLFIAWLFLLGACAPAASNAPAAAAKPATGAATSGSGPPAMSPSNASGASPSGGAGSSTAPTTAAAAAPLVPQRTQVAVGFVPAVQEAPYYVAKDKGYFDAENLDVDLLPVRASAEAVTQVGVGNLQAADVALNPATLNAFAGGVDIKIIAGEYGTPPTASDGFMFLVRKALFDSGAVRDVAALRGRKLAFSSASGFGWYAVDRMLREAGLSLDDVDATIMTFGDMPAAFANAVVDAAFMPDPFGPQTIELGVAVSIATQFLRDTQVGVVVVGEAFQKDPRLAEAFLRAYLRALRDLERDGYTSPEHAAIIEKYTNVPLAVLQKLARPYAEPELRINVASLMDQQRFYLERGELRYGEPLDLTRWIDERPRTAAVRAYPPR
jgi:NitT/TauT family transport system substrate-binding protein